MAAEIIPAGTETEEKETPDVYLISGFSMKGIEYINLLSNHAELVKKASSGHHVLQVMSDRKQAVFCFTDEEEAKACLEEFRPYCPSIRLEQTDVFTRKEYEKMMKPAKKRSIFREAKRLLGSRYKAEAEEAENEKEAE